MIIRSGASAGITIALIRSALISEANLSFDIIKSQSSSSVNASTFPFVFGLYAFTANVESSSQYIAATIEASANLMTSRMVSFGALSEASRLQVKKYQWNSQMDAVTCPFCRGMHGKIFNVQPNLDRLSNVVLSQDPSVAKALTPWPQVNIGSINQMAGFSNDKLEGQGFSLPPAHPRCRCVTTQVGSVPLGEIKGFQKLRRNVPGGVRDQMRNTLPDVPTRTKPWVAQTKAGSTEEMWKLGDEWLPQRVRTIHNPAVDDLLKKGQTVAVEEKPTSWQSGLQEVIHSGI